MSAQGKRFESPDETRSLGKGTLEVLTFGNSTAARLTAEPGWRWSEHVKPVVGTDSCQAAHFGYVLAGRLHIVTDDGGDAEVGPGDTYVVEPGHDAWVVGDEAFVALEFQSSTAATYAKGN
jgi:quercetin dioxygenase-like cupin family protein